MAGGLVSYELDESVAMVRIDDGKANAISPDLVAAVDEALDRAEKEARCVVIAGRPGRFSAGFDLNIMRQGGDAVVRMVTAGAELALRLYGFPTPVVMACTGHAMAMGAVLLLTADTRFGVEGDFKIGLNEVAIGMTLPVFGVEFSRERLSPRYLTRAVAGAEIYDPEAAVEVGFLDRVVAAEALLDEARAEAQRLAGLDQKAHYETKLRLRGRAIRRIRESLSESR
ncbi:crotonase/enoyl-CoA hydratase family protein [bacterium]|nr:crotonase/enoyl-CoA hydratase family protein [bacterium]